MNKKPKCHNCLYAGEQFKIDKLTHLHCNHPKYKTDPPETVWETLCVFSDTCGDHEFKKSSVNL